MKRFGAKGLAWLKVTADGFSGPIAKFFKDSADQVKQAAGAHTGDLILFAADTRKVVADSLGYLRTSIAKEQGMIDEAKFAFLWVVDWPLFEYSEEFHRYIAAHHPFTMPNEEDVQLLDTDPHKAHAQSYDIVLNGYELGGGGSIRIHQRSVQEKMFKALALPKKKQNSNLVSLLMRLIMAFHHMAGWQLGLIVLQCC